MEYKKSTQDFISKLLLCLINLCTFIRNNDNSKFKILKYIFQNCATQKMNESSDKCSYIRYFLIIMQFLNSPRFSDRLIHFTWIYSRILMPCFRPRFTECFVILYVTFIIIRVEWTKYLLNSFHPTRISKMLKCPYVPRLTDRVE